MKFYSSLLMIALLTLAAPSCSAADQALAPGTSSPRLASITPRPAATTPPEPTPTAAGPPSERINIDSEWVFYKNHRLGFAIKIPRIMFHSRAGCTWNEENHDDSYRLQPGKVPVVVIEGQDRVYITSKYRAELIEATRVPSGQGYRSTFGGCDLQENTLQSVSQREYSSFIWEIVIRPIFKNDDLEALVDDVYGECFSVGEILPMESSDYRRVTIVGDKKPGEESECLLRGMYVFLYSPDLDTAATWSTGQTAYFSASGVNQDPYDSEMLASFRFIPRK